MKGETEIESELSPILHGAFFKSESKLGNADKAKDFASLARTEKKDGLQCLDATRDQSR